MTTKLYAVPSLVQEVLGEFAFTDPAVLEVRVEEGVALDGHGLHVQVDRESLGEETFLLLPQSEGALLQVLARCLWPRRLGPYDRARWTIGAETPAGQGWCLQAGALCVRVDAVQADFDDTAHLYIPTLPDTQDPMEALAHTLVHRGRLARALGENDRRHGTEGVLWALHGLEDAQERDRILDWLQAEEREFGLPPWEVLHVDVSQLPGGSRA